MPELPEVETLVRQLRPLLIGREVVSSQLSHDDILDGVTRKTLLRELGGRIITGVERRAKHALIHTDKKLLAVQPGMTGTLLTIEGKPGAGDIKYAVLRCQLDNGSVLIYRDMRRIGTLRWLAPTQWEEYAARLGPEPLDPKLTPEALAAAMQRSRSPIKKVLMDQRFLVGVGNIYANEALFASGIDPSKPASDLSPHQYRNLLGQIKRILRAAIRAEGTTFRDYRTSTGKPGGFQRVLKVYGREGTPCPSCGTTLTGTHSIDGRMTVFCHRCQS